MNISTKKNVFLSKNAEKFFEKLKNNELEKRLRSAIDTLSTKPIHSGSVNISGKTWRVCVGDYRIIDNINPAQIVVTKIAHRREVYRRLGLG